MLAALLAALPRQHFDQLSLTVAGNAGNAHDITAIETDTFLNATRPLSSVA